MSPQPVVAGFVFGLSEPQRQTAAAFAYQA